MKKQLLKSALIAVAGVGLLAGSAMALSLDAGYSWSSADYWTGSQPDADFRLVIHNDWNLGGFGLYSVANIGSPSSPYRLSLFNDSDSLGAEATIVWTNVGGSGSILDAQVYKGGVLAFTALDFGTVFGFYGQKQCADGWCGSEYWYTDARLNGDKQEHVFVSYQGGANPALDNAYIYVAGSKDDRDPLGKMQAIDLNPVPEPASMLLFGAGLLGLAGTVRRNRKS